ncbi:MAG TPA: hypothetical protein DCR93_31900 [Cytophagales bacterium]|nr:hypothetical protein [Cytophagales bacterium]HAP63898.1 hypothetical protein [Cytophagales bacterium]
MKYSKKIAKDFEESWKKVESFFTDAINAEGGKHLTPLLDLIHQFKERELHLHLRAGQSMYFLALTRARMHGGDYSVMIKITTDKQGKFEIFRYEYQGESGNPRSHLTLVDPFSNDQFNSWIEELKSHEIT